MTLKIRLMAMMIVLVMGVLALQFILTEREKRELTSEIERLGSEMSSSARDVSVRAFVASRSGHPVRDVLMAIDDTVPSGGQRTSVRYMRTEGFADGRSTDVVIEHEQHLDYPAGVPGFPHAGEDSLDVAILLVEAGGELDSLRDLAWEEALQTGHSRRIFESPDGRVLASFTYEASDSTLDETENVQHWFSRSPEHSPGTGSTLAFHAPSRIGSTWLDENEFSLRLPIPFVEHDSLHFVEISYPIASLTDRLAASRRRSFVWVASLLGVGVIGAALMAAQFTRPIRTLERSFRRVEEGDLDVAVSTGRDDEIGRLTSSFNHMVGRLRQSREMEERLRESERLATLGRLAAGVAHEVRNPLNAIKLTMQQLRDKTAPEKGHPLRGDFDRYYGTVSSELERLEGVVGAFLDLTRSESLHLESTNLVTSLRGSVELFRAKAAESGVSLTLEAPEQVLLQADPARLAAVWNNLLSNALGATDRGGRVTVRVSVVDETANVQVIDTGAGIPEAELARIWEPFYSRRPDGTGLGLGIVRSVVERHRGTVDARSREGEGTTMTVTLPIDGGTADDAS